MDKQLNKLKVGELQDLLKAHNMDSKGTKAELVARLAAANIGPGAAPAAAAPTAAAPAAAKPAAPATTPAAAPKPAATAAAAPAAKPAAAAAPTPKPAAAAAATGATPAADAPKTEGGADHNPLEMSMEERKKLRAAKFGLAIDEDEEAKKKLRAAKFGLTDTSKETEKIKAREDRFKNEAAMTPEELERIKKRAERFGTVVATPAPAAAKGNKAAAAAPKSTDPKMLAREARFAAQTSS